MKTTAERQTPVSTSESGALLGRLDRLAERFATLAEWLAEAADELARQGTPPSENLAICLSSARREFGIFRERVLESAQSFSSYPKGEFPASSSLSDLKAMLQEMRTAEDAAREAERDRSGSQRFAREIQGSNDSETADYFANLAVLHHKQGKFADAEELHQMALLMREKCFGCEHHKVASSLNNLALLYRDQGRIEEAKELWERSLAIVEKVFGPEHPKTGLRLSNLAALFYTQGEYEKAEKLYQRLLAILQKRRMQALSKRSSLRKILDTLRIILRRPTHPKTQRTFVHA
jgi:tetratricopeptide (TPR) repeat protein